MFNWLTIEAQISKRLRNFFAQKASENHLDPSKMKFVIRSECGRVAAHFYEQNRHIRPVTLRSVAEAFGKEYEEAKVSSVHDYLVRTAAAANIPLEKINVVICEHAGNMGSFLYNDKVYLRRIESIELLSIFNFSK